MEAPATSNLLDDPRFTLVCIGFWTLIIGWTTSFGLINAFPTIWLGETGVTITAFLFFKIHLPWSEIIDINIGGVRFGHDLVLAHRITIFHRIYGLLYSHTYYPGFIIRKDIIDRDKLLSEIIQNTSSPKKKDK